MTAQLELFPTDDQVCLTLCPICGNEHSHIQMFPDTSETYCLYCQMQQTSKETIQTLMHQFLEVVKGVRGIKGLAQRYNGKNVSTADLCQFCEAIRTHIGEDDYSYAKYPLYYLYRKHGFCSDISLADFVAKLIEKDS